MFGLIHALICGISYIQGDIKETTFNGRERCKSKKGYYIDYNGFSRDVKTNHKIYQYRDDNGDYIVRDTKNGSYRNISAEKRNKLDYDNRSKAEENGDTVYPIFKNVSDIANGEKKSGVEGGQYKDIITGQIYVKRRMKTIACTHKELDDLYEKIKDYPYVDLFMNLDGYFIRPTDKELKLNRNLDYNNVINYYNAERDYIQKKFNRIEYHNMNGMYGEDKKEFKK